MGANPEGAVTLDARGDIFGTTVGGGANNQGALFELEPGENGYVAKLVHSFSQSVDGSEPLSRPVIDPNSGNMYVTADLGGSQGFGTLLELSPSGMGYADAGVYSFLESNGDQPFAEPAIVNNTVYVTSTVNGPRGYGTILALTAQGLAPTLLYSFPGYAGDGEEPFSGLVPDGTGALYGTTIRGGANGNGTVYKIVPSGSGVVESVLWSFKANSGSAGPAGDVVFDTAGNIYGATYNGGSQDDGVVYKLTPGASGYAETVLHEFRGSDGANPWGSVALVGDMLWGTTIAGGSGTCDCGTIFSISTAGTRFKVQHSFAGTDGSQPYGGLVARGHTLYGTTYAGGPGTNDVGVVFQFVN